MVKATASKKQGQGIKAKFSSFTAQAKVTASKKQGQGIKAKFIASHKPSQIYMKAQINQPENLI